MFICFFFFKQKTAYEIGTGDWSSDVCSSDLRSKIRIGNKLYFGENDELVAEVIDNTTSRGRTLRFLFDGPHEEFKKTMIDRKSVV